MRFPYLRKSKGTENVKIGTSETKKLKPSVLKVFFIFHKQLLGCFQKSIHVCIRCDGHILICSK